MNAIDSGLIMTESTNNINNFSSLRKESEKFAKNELQTSELDNIKAMYQENIISNEAIILAFYNAVSFGVETIGTMKTIYDYATGKQLDWYEYLCLSMIVIHAILLVIFPNYRQRNIAICKYYINKFIIKISNAIDMRKYR